VPLNDIMSHMSRDYESWVTDDAKCVMVLNISGMISTFTLVTRASAQVLKPQGADEKLHFQCDEVQHQVCFPHSFMLINTIPNPMGPSTSSGMSRKVLNYC